MQVTSLQERVVARIFPRCGNVFVVALLAFAAGTGCGKSGPRNCQIYGTVTIDGVPAREGAIRFDIVTDGDLPSGATISDGRYETWVKPGPKIVRLVVAGSREGLAERDMAANIVPAKYEKEPLRIDVDKSGVFDFQLTTD